MKIDKTRRENIAKAQNVVASIAKQRKKSSPEADKGVDLAKIAEELAARRVKANEGE